ncbi:DUF7544 domain-containing protein [Paracidobacterium acidisoli]|uniref:DUF4013 domain-containing protein n=1 Tax=Paracidobacterium acidisoli TaxID=2303751 RepID=A0A372ILX9_9BACT|nr:hypothetical protein [Paracidobacterium acidisoli]MBT9332505.1 hypothetical protein [Paracidobacterium acidisoli]
MKPLSPLDALQPAFARTLSVLGKPFRFWFFVKIALVAALTQPSFFSVIVSYPLQAVQFAVAGRLPHRRPTWGAASSFAGTSGASASVFAISAFIVIALIGLVIWVVISYLYCRLRFTLFDLVVYRHGKVGEGWSKYGRQSWRFFGLILLVSLVFLLAAAVTAGPIIIHMIASLHGMTPEDISANPFVIFGHMLPLVFILFALALLWSIADAIMQDFLLPPMAIDDAPLESAFARFFRLFGDRPGSVLLYLLLRFVIALGLSWVLIMAAMIVLVLFGLGGGGLGFLLWHALWHTGLAGQSVFVAYCIAAGLLFLVLYLLAMVSIYGSVAVFKESYAVYFFGSHYPELGSRLDPPSEEDLVGVRLPVPLPPLTPLQEPPPLW